MKRKKVAAFIQAHLLGCFELKLVGDLIDSFPNLNIEEKMMAMQGTTDD